MAANSPPLAEARKIAEGPLDPRRKAEILAEARRLKVAEFREQFANPYIAAERGYVDAVIRPRETRRRMIAALEMLDGKREKSAQKAWKSFLCESRL
jgi:propionyl-CoA carboxylase beta chain